MKEALEMAAYSLADVRLSYQSSHPLLSVLVLLEAVDVDAGVNREMNR
jgi:hypothetical protein